MSAQLFYSEMRSQKYFFAVQNYELEETSTYDDHERERERTYVI